MMNKQLKQTKNARYRQQNDGYQRRRGLGINKDGKRG